MVKLTNIIIIHMIAYDDSEKKHNNVSHTTKANYHIKSHLFILKNSCID